MTSTEAQIARLTAQQEHTASLLAEVAKAVQQHGEILAGFKKFETDAGKDHEAYEREIATLRRRLDKLANRWYWLAGAAAGIGAAAGHGLVELLFG